MFSDLLQADLVLKIGSATFTIPGGNVKAFEVDLHAYGFEASATFCTSPELGADALMAPFTTKDLIKATLSIKGMNDVPTPPPDPLVVEGIVTTKSVREIATRAPDGVGILFRSYTVHFADPASVLWRQHFPCDLLSGTDATLGKAIDGAKAEGIAIDKTWDLLETKQPLVTLALGADPRGSSFYDFVCWIVARGSGYFSYDSKTRRYSISGEKAAAGTPVVLPAPLVASHQVAIPETSRRSAAVLNAAALDPTNEPVPSDDAVAGIRRDALVRTAVPAQKELAKTLEAASLESDLPRFCVAFARFPTVTFRPGVLLKLDSKSWNSRHAFAKKTFRIRSLKLSARAFDQDPQANRNQPTASYEADMDAVLEEKADPGCELPPFVAPTYPIQVEGKILAPGEGTDRTYLISENTQIGGWVYDAQVPLWNKKINLPFERGDMSPHMYFPAFRETRVLVELGLHEARLHRTLDWGAGVRIPMAGQGNHMILGKNATSETQIRHDYVDSKPELFLRRFDQGDEQTLKIMEGTMTFVVKFDQAQAPLTPTYDVTVQVEAAKAEITGKVGGGVSEVASTGTVETGKLASTITETSGATEEKISGAETAVTSRADAAAAEMEGMKSALAEGLGGVVAGAATAKAEIKAAIDG